MVTASVLALLIVAALFCTSNRIQVLIAFDQLINARLGGWADETMSARCWRLRGLRRRYAVMVKVINAVFFWQENHCLRSYVSEQNRRHLPIEYRQ